MTLYKKLRRAILVCISA